MIYSDYLCFLMEAMIKLLIEAYILELYQGGGKQLVRYSMILSAIFDFRLQHHPPPAVGTLSTN